MILSADKGNVSVIMDIKDYTSKTRAILDEDKCCFLSRDHTLQVGKKIASLLKAIQPDGFFGNLCDQLTLRYSDLPLMYGLPKVHKEGVPMRPSISTMGLPHSITWPRNWPES